jgi:hypothetical protein
MMHMLLCSRADNLQVRSTSVAITIRNKETEAIIRRLGKRRNEGPSAVVSRLAKEALAREGQVSQEEYERRMRAFEQLAREFPPPEPKVPWSEIEAEMQSLFDYLDEEEMPASESSR